MRLGVDLGGTKTEAAVLDDRGEVRWRRRAATPRGDYERTLATIAGLVDEAERACGARLSVGVGTPGACDRATGRMKNCNSTWLNGRTLPADLEATLERRIRVANDADCFTLSEAVDGAGVDARTVFGVILGTGVGGGIVVEGGLLAGASGLAGEWGHNRLEPALETAPAAIAGALEQLASRSCYCGRVNCVETWVSGPGLARTAVELGGPAGIGAAELARHAGNERWAREALAVHAWLLARALAAVVNVLDPEVIVAGGGLSRLEGLYRDVPAQWSEWIFGGETAARLLRARHGDASGVRGAAWLWPPTR